MSGEILWLLALGVFFFFMMRGGGCCGGHNHSDHGHGHGDHSGGGSDNDGLAPRKADSPGRIEHITAASQNSCDPVGGMTVGGEGESPQSAHCGETFSFCSERCRKLFDLNPGKYVQSTYST